MPFVYAQSDHTFLLWNPYLSTQECWQECVNTLHILPLIAVCLNWGEGGGGGLVKSADMGIRVFLFFSYLNFTFITVDNIYHSQNVSSNHNETLTVTYLHSAEMVEFRYGFKLLRLAFRFLL